MTAAEQRTVYIDELTGTDKSDGSGSQELPYKTLLFAYRQQQDPATCTFQVRKPATTGGAADESARGEWTQLAKTALKKVAKQIAAQEKKARLTQTDGKERGEEAAAEERLRILEEAKKIVLEEDSSLPETRKIRLNEKDDIQLRPSAEQEPPVAGTRVRVLGRVHRERKQKGVLFVTLRDGYGFLQCILAGKLAKTYDALTLTRETSMEIRGEMCEVPRGAHAPDDRELRADYFRIEKFWKAAGGSDAITNRVAVGAEPSTLLDLRHLTLRGETASSMMFVRDAVEFAFHQAFKEKQLRKVSPPALVQTQVEGGSTLFQLDYYGDTAFLTQSSQLYLETCLPSMGDVYCIEKSFRAEKSLTRRHLSEYAHVEAELDFISFDDLLRHIEHVMCRVLELALADPRIERYVKELNPDFRMPQRPFMRMRYAEAIDWLNAHAILNEDGNPHVFGDDIAEAAERRMTDAIGLPIFLTHFPVAIKSFYMMPDSADPRVTESVDCLLPGVGEIVGGSMRKQGYDDLLVAFDRHGIDPSGYYWYTDQRKYGSSPHGGYGLGIERFLAWLCKRHTVRECCLYPRYMGRCIP